MKLANRILIQRSPIKVFEVLAQLENLPRWNHAIRETRKVSPGPVGTGSNGDGVVSPVPAGTGRRARSPTYDAPSTQPSSHSTAVSLGGAVNSDASVPPASIPASRRTVASTCSLSWTSRELMARAWKSEG
jgi:hypothetical protein